MTPRDRKHLLLLAIAVATWVAVAGCAEPPKPFKPGTITIEPPACEELRKRGGEC